MKTLKLPLFLISLFSLVFIKSGNAQNEIVQDFSRVMEIPKVKVLEASASHMYALSAAEGMAVFRIYTDSLQWLYTSSGMQKRGDKIVTDIRFAYLFGNTKRLTVLEPTSVLGVYSSTMLPGVPIAVTRLENRLYIALNELGLGVISLDSPETVDSKVTFAAQDILMNSPVIDVASSSLTNQLFVLTKESVLHVFASADTSIKHISTIRLNHSVQKIFIDKENVWGSTQKGEIFEINADGLGKKTGTIGEIPSKIINWNDIVIVRGLSGKVWTKKQTRAFRLWKNDGDAGNFLAKSDHTLWISENDNVSLVKLKTTSNQNHSDISRTLKIKPIKDVVLPYPNPLILGLELENNYPPENVKFFFRSDINNAKITKQGLLWVPSLDQQGLHWFKIIATSTDGKTDSTHFNVDVRAFNAPPQFSPYRTTSIVVNDPYELKIRAIDPEGSEDAPIKYLGIDLPESSSLNEQTGVFTWTPTRNQTGDVSFRVIATDELGTSSELTVTLTVVDLGQSN